MEPRDAVKVVAMASDEMCEHYMLVLIQWNRRQFAVLLIQLEDLRVDEEARQAIYRSASPLG